MATKLSKKARKEMYLQTTCLPLAADYRKYSFSGRHLSVFLSNDSLSESGKKKGEKSKWQLHHGYMRVSDPRNKINGGETRKIMNKYNFA